MSKTPSILEDSRWWDQAEEAEEDDPRTQAEKNIYWIEEEWKDALRDDTYDAWRDIQMMIFGARMALLCAPGMLEELDLLFDLRGLAIEHRLECIKNGSHE